MLLPVADCAAYRHRQWPQDPCSAQKFAILAEALEVYTDDLRPKPDINITSCCMVPDGG
jgi:hypothetical protein